MVETTVYYFFIASIFISISFFVITFFYLKAVEKRVLAQVAAEKALEAKKAAEQSKQGPVFRSSIKNKD